MGEPQQQQKPAAKKVLSLGVKDGGLQMGSHGTQTFLPGALVGVEMELANSLGGVLVHYPHRNPDGKVVKRNMVVPFGHIRQYEVEE